MILQSSLQHLADGHTFSIILGRGEGTIFVKEPVPNHHVRGGSEVCYVQGSQVQGAGNRMGC